MLKQSPLGVKPGFEGGLVGPVDGLLDHQDGGARHRRDDLRGLHRLVEQAVEGHDAAREPAALGSSASIMRAVRQRSIAFALPATRGRRWVPPSPGGTPSLISGCPKRALSAAMTISQAIASSQPPPSA